uniref:Coatomer subunit gamma n=1 Tax=Echinococcus granulosus TaxID=6210 RepID=A0A068WNX8_ECHGR|nr:Coatomer subunit gamma [Echinococcus granulosus]
MLSLRKDKTEEDDGIGSTYMNVDKSAVLQDARLFNANQPNPRKCIQILTRILCLLNKGVKFSRQEATTTFFAVTKLFQLPNVGLRKLLYLVIKELAPYADDVIILTSSLTKDMTGSEASFRAPAIRTLCKITDPTMVQAIERYLKQAVVDKSPAIASAVLASAYHLMQTCPEVVRRWSNEIQGVISGPNIMVQYHALGLLYLIRQNDRLATLKLIQKFLQSPLRSSYAHCVMIRIVARQIEEEGLADNRNMMDFLETSLRHKSEMVIYEAARAIIGLSQLTAKELAPAVNVLQLFCSSHKSSLRYAAVRTLNKIATRHPSAVAFCNHDLENLVSDPNRSIATLAITTLLKTGSENNVDRLLKHICSFMTDITDEFKVVVLESIRMLAAKYPRKYSVLLNFLSGLLRDPAGYEFKKAVVVAMESIIKDNPQAKNLGLLQLCEFIEDCQHEKLTQRALYLLGREGPFLNRPRQFIRFIYNRIILESAAVKCTATTALARFGANCDDLLPSVLVLLERVMLDDDDEVRDRAAFYHYILSSGDRNLMKEYVLNDDIRLNMQALERALLAYTQASEAEQARPFDFTAIPIEEPPSEIASDFATIADSSTVGFFEPTIGASAATIPGTAAGDSAKVGGAVDAAPGSTGGMGTRRQDRFAEELGAVPEIKALGPLFKSSNDYELTDSGTEYVVTCVIHTFLHHIVLQYDVTNTMEDQLLEDVYVDVEVADDEFEVLNRLPIKTLPFNSPASTYIIVKLPENASLTTSFANTLRFVVKDVNTAGPNDPGITDEYALEELTLPVAVHMQRVMKANFAAAWEEYGDNGEAEETYFLTKFSTLDEMVQELVAHLGMQACERTDQVGSSEKAAHTLLLAGVFRGGVSVLARCKLAKSLPSAGQPAAGINLQITVRSAAPEINQAIADSLS